MLTEDILQSISKNDNFKNKQLLCELAELFKDKPEVLEFLDIYANYGELVDDMIDDPGNNLTVQKADELSIKIGECRYWQKHQQHLWVVRWIIHNQYFDSVKLEGSSEQWKRQDAKVLSHAGSMMLFAVILIEYGIDKLNEISIKFREHMYERHKDDPI